MKRRLFWVAALVTMIMACNNLKRLVNINFNIPYNQQINVPPIAPDVFPQGGMSITLPAFAIATNSQHYIDSFHTSSDKILRVNLSTLSMTQTGSADVNNFNFLDSISVYVYGQTMPRQLIAYKYDIPKGLNSLSLDTVSNTNLKQYFLLDTMYIQIAAHYNTAPIGNTVLDIHSIFHLLANPLD